jgi:c-di-GMP-binding flagellar brake protein YcgR
VAVALLAGTAYQRLEGRGRDLSVAGMGILLAAELAGGEVVGLRFSLPDSGDWEVRAVLRHRRGYHYGFEFLALTAAQKESLAEHVRGLERVD